MADDHGAAAEVFQGFLQGAQGVHVQVVGGLVQQQDVGPLPQHLGQVYAVALAPGEHGHLLLLLLAGKVEARHVSPGIDPPGAQFDLLLSAGDFFPDVIGAVQVAVLVHIGQLDGVPYPDLAAVGRFRPGDHFKEGGLAGAVGADHADNAAGGQAEGHVFHQQPFAVGLAHLIGRDDHVPQPGAGGDEELQVLFPGFGLLGKQFFVGADAGLALGVAPLGGHADPFQFPGQGFLPGALRFFLLAQALLLLLQPAGVVAFPGNAVAPVEFENPARHVVQEIAVVGHGDDGARVLLQMMLQPGHALGIEMVGGLVQQQDVGLLQQEAAERHPPPLPAGDHIDGGIRRRTAQGAHGHVQPGVQVPGVERVESFLDLALALDELVHGLVVHGLSKLHVDGFELLEEIGGFLNPLFHHLPHGLGFVHQGLLFEIAHSVALGEKGFSVELRVDPGHDAQQRALAGAVEPQHADLGAVEIGQGNILQNGLFVIEFADLDHRVDDLFGILAHLVVSSWVAGGL